MDAGSGIGRRDLAGKLAPETAMNHLPTTLVALSLLTACHSGPAPAADAPTWAIAIHGGAGTLGKNRPAAEFAEYEAVLTRALRHGADLLDGGAEALDVCEAVVRILEDDPHFNAGYGAVFNAVGAHELDASIMDGATMRCGAVTGVRTVKNPVSLARLVMTKTPHVLLMGDGAEQFADSVGVERVPNSHFDTPSRKRALERALRAQEKNASIDLPQTKSDRYGTVGCVVRDRRGHLAAATSTGGMTAKRFGRVGDAPVIGAGNYADDTVAVSCTGTGEEFIRHSIAHSVSAHMKLAGQSLEQATHAVIFDVLQKDDGGLISVDKDGNLATPFNSEGMYRGTANSAGRFEIAIF